MREHELNEVEFHVKDNICLKSYYYNLILFIYQTFKHKTIIHPLHSHSHKRKENKEKVYTLKTNFEKINKNVCYSYVIDTLSTNI